MNVLDDEGLFMKKSRKYTGIYTATGMCMGSGIGVCFGVSLDHLGLWMPVFLCIGLAVGAALGKRKDDAINAQIEEKGYTIQKMEYNEEEKTYQIVVVSKEGDQLDINVPESVAKSQKLEVGTLVYIDENNNVDNPFLER